MEVKKDDLAAALSRYCLYGSGSGTVLGLMDLLHKGWIESIQRRGDKSVDYAPIFTKGINSNTNINYCRIPAFLDGERGGRVLEYLLMLFHNGLCGERKSFSSTVILYCLCCSIKVYFSKPAVY